MSNTKELTVDVRGSLCPKPVIETKWLFAKMVRISTSL